MSRDSATPDPSEDPAGGEAAAGSAGPVSVARPELEDLLRAQLGPHLAPDLCCHLGDEHYVCPSLEEAHGILRRAAVDEHAFIRDKFDCDDFAFLVKARFIEAAYADAALPHGYCLGIAWGRRLPRHHALNWLVTADRVLRLIEPMNSRIFLPGENHGLIYLVLA